MMRLSTLAGGRARGALLRNGGHRIPSAAGRRLLSSSAASASLLGHSPMAPAAPSSSSSVGSQIPTAQDVTTSGGVWAPSSAKREKLKELRGELAELKDPSKASLDDLATPAERRDLYLADGVAAIAAAAEGAGKDSSEAAIGSDLEPVIRGIEEALSSPELTKAQWEATLTSVAKLLETRLAVIPPERCLRDVRDFYIPPADAAAEGGRDADASGDAPAEPAQARDAVLRFRLLLALGAAEHLRASWAVLTTVSDQDVDRAAVAGAAVVDPQAGTVDADKVKRVLEAYLTQDCAGWTQAMWDLMDRDGDGRIDESEMNEVGRLTVEPVRKALARIFREALEASPVRTAAAVPDDATLVPVEAEATKPAGWRQRRREAKEKKRLLKLFQRTIETHFVDEVEMPHRMRCIYAWANKEHQNNAIDSVLVDEAGWSGRKRYVELHPKIAYSEFKEVQQEHFAHLDRIGTEFLKGFREQLWVIQGRHRQRRSLYRNCTLFLIGISIVDYAILAL